MGSITVDENDLDFRSATPKRMTPSKTPLRSFLKSPKYFEDSENSLVIVGSLTKSIKNAWTSSNRVCSEQVKQIGFQNLKEQKNLSIETQEEFKIEEENSLVKSN